MPTDLGAECDMYKWKQSLAFVYLYLPLPARTEAQSKRKVVVLFKSRQVNVLVNGEYFLQGYTLQEIVPDEATWHIDTESDILEVPYVLPMYPPSDHYPWGVCVPFSPKLERNLCSTPVRHMGLWEGQAGCAVQGRRLPQATGAQGNTDCAMSWAVRGMGMQLGLGPDHLPRPSSSGCAAGRPPVLVLTHPPAPLPLRSR